MWGEPLQRDSPGQVTGSWWEVVIRIATISLPGAFDRAAFVALEAELEQTFPRAHGLLQVEAVSRPERPGRRATDHP